MTETSGREKVLEEARPDAARLLRDALPYVRDAGQDGDVRWQGLIADIEEALSDHDALGRGVNIEAIERAREHVVIAIAFLNRDHGTGRATKTVPQIVNGLVKADEILRAALASPSTPEPALRGGKVEEIADALADCFKQAIADSASKPFEQTGVALPARAVWINYATAAALRTHAGESAAQLAGLVRERREEELREDERLGKAMARAEAAEQALTAEGQRRESAEAALRLFVESNFDKATGGNAATHFSRYAHADDLSEEGKGG